MKIPLPKKVAYLSIAFVASMCLTISTGQAYDCKYDKISKLYEMIYAPLIPFQSPLNDEGTLAGSPEELFMKRSQHYFDQLKDLKELRIPLKTYAVLTREIPDALLDFETKLIIVLPDCQEISMYNGAPIGQLITSYETMIEITSIGLDSELNQIVEFASKSITPKPMPFKVIMKMLSNDLSLNPEVISTLMPKPIIDRYFPGGTIPISNLSEASLLTFTALGGEIYNDESIEDVPDRLFLVVPKSYSGISENYSSIILTSYGDMIKTAALNVDLTAQILVRLGIQVDVLTLKQVITESEGTCGIDAAGRWFQLIQGRKIRTCPFFTMTEQMFATGSYIETQDFVDQNTVFRTIDGILKKIALDKDSLDS
jgi:hypothetical protein